MTNNLHKHVWQHKTHAFEGFTDDYNAVRLVYWESIDDVRNAIDREKKLKGWRREKKLWLIARFNPGWKDLAAEWYETQGPSTALGMTRLGSFEQVPENDDTAARKKGTLKTLRATS